MVFLDKNERTAYAESCIKTRENFDLLKNSDDSLLKLNPNRSAMVGIVDDLVGMDVKSARRYLKSCYKDFNVLAQLCFEATALYYTDQEEIRNALRSAADNLMKEIFIVTDKSIQASPENMVNFSKAFDRVCKQISKPKRITYDLKDLN